MIPHPYKQLDRFTVSTEQALASNGHLQAVREHLENNKYSLASSVNLGETGDDYISGS